MKIAIQGCCHGELEALYGSIALIESQESIKIDLLIICGDFQSIRNGKQDMNSLACPNKYRQIGQFYAYYSGEKKAPVPTLFIGGNHEASNYLWELYHGGWVAENIYFLGFAGVVNFGGLRIGGLSGIYKSHHYDMGFFEKQPYDEDTCRSIYHIRKFNVHRLAQIKRPMDIFLSHDWPKGIARHGNTAKLFKLKPFLEREVHTNVLGSAPAEILLKRLKPSFWFSAHLHVKYSAIYDHNAISGLNINPDEIQIDDDDDDDEQENQIQVSQPVQSNVTKFLALDKILPGRDFLQILDFRDSDAPKEILYDEEWLAIVKTMNEYFSMERAQKIMPNEAELQARIKNSLHWVQANISSDVLKMRVPPFIATAPAHPHDEGIKSTDVYQNPQTIHFCNLLDIQNYINTDGILPNT